MGTIKMKTSGYARTTGVRAMGVYYLELYHCSVTTVIFELLPGNISTHFVYYHKSHSNIVSNNTIFIVTYMNL